MTTDEMIIQGVRVGPAEARILAFYAVGHSINLIAYACDRPVASVARTIADVRSSRPMAALIALTWQHKTGRLVTPSNKVLPPGTVPKAAEIRAWAASSGMACSSRGPVPQYLMLAYEKARAGT